MKPLSDQSPLGKALFLLGGAVVTGTIIALSSKSEEVAREPLRKTIDTDESIKILSVKIDKPKVLSEPTKGPDNLASKYPPEYYSLSKGAQYRFRKKLQNN